MTTDVYDKQCLTVVVQGDFDRYDYSSATTGLLTPGYDLPTDADGVNTFYFGSGYDKDVHWCESQCGLVSHVSTGASHSAAS